MGDFSYELEARLHRQRDTFRSVMMDDNLFARILAASLPDWPEAAMPATVLMQPSLMPERLPDGLSINSGVQVGFQSAIPGREQILWRYLDLYHYRPESSAYTAQRLVVDHSGGDETEISALYQAWHNAVRQLIEPFGPHDLRLNGYTGEIDLRQNIEENRYPILLPAQE